MASGDEPMGISAAEERTETAPVKQRTKKTPIKERRWKNSAKECTEKALVRKRSKKFAIKAPKPYNRAQPKREDTGEKALGGIPVRTRKENIPAKRAGRQLARKKRTEKFLLRRARKKK